MIGFMGPRSAAALLTAIALFLGACSTSQGTVERSDRRQMASLARSDLREGWNGRDLLDPEKMREIRAIEGAPWQPPRQFAAVLANIRQRLNATGGLITVPEGGFELRDCEGNLAMATPDGRILVCRGVFEASGSEDMIAFVLAHEAAHVLRGHVGPSATPRLMVAGGVLLWIGAAAAIGQDPSGSLSRSLGQLAAMTLPSRASQSAFAWTERFTVPQELEADRLAVDLLVRAGYNPESAIAHIELVAPRVVSQVRDGWIPTSRFYPDHESRIEAIRTYLDTHYPNRRIVQTDVPWATGQEDSELQAYYAGVAEADRAFAITRGVVALRLREQGLVEPRPRSRERRRAGQQADRLCQEVIRTLELVFSGPAGLDRAVRQKAAAASFFCASETGYDWLLAMRDAPTAGFWLYEDLAAFHTYVQGRGGLDRDIVSHYGYGVSRFAYWGRPYGRALNVGRNLLRSDLEYAAFQECERREDASEERCGRRYFGSSLAAPFLTDSDNRRSWNDILEDVQSPTVNLIRVLDEAGRSSISSGSGLPAEALAVLNPPPIPIQVGSTAVTTTRVNLRAAPTTGASSLRRIEAGVAVTVTGAAENGFRPVSIGAVRGWIAENFLARE